MKTTNPMKPTETIADRAARRFAALPPEARAYCARHGADEWCQDEPPAVRLEIARLCRVDAAGSR